MTNAVNNVIGKLQEKALQLYTANRIALSTKRKAFDIWVFLIIVIGVIAAAAVIVFLLGKNANGSGGLLGSINDGISNFIDKIFNKGDSAIS